MSREVQTITINGNEWAIKPFDGMKGLRIQTKLSKLLAPLIGGMDQEVSQIVDAIVTQLDEESTPQLIKELLSETFVNKQRISDDKVFEDHFAQNYVELYQGLYEVLKVNFTDLLELANNYGALDGRVQAANSQAS